MSILFRLSAIGKSLSRLRRSRSPEGSRTRQLGQVLPLFALMAVVLLGGAALLTDVAWWWTAEQRMQRAADAAALAGAKHLPGNQARAFAAAVAEAAKNGFVHGANGVTVAPSRVSGSPNVLVVDIDAPVETHFARVFCWDGGPCLRSVDVGVTGAGELELPIPMGSLDSYYGVFGKLRTPGGGTQGPPVPGSTDSLLPNAAVSGDWTATSGSVIDAVRAEDTTYAQTNRDARVHVFGTFGLLAAIPIPAANETLTIRGIEVLLDDTHVSATCDDSYVQVHLSWNGGSNWSSVPNPNTLNDTPDLTTDQRDFVVGSASDTLSFPGRTWVRDDFRDDRFRVRLTATKGSCASATEIRVDQVRVRVSYARTSFIPDANITDPYGQTIAPRGLWGTFISQGAEKINGDAYLPKWDPRTSPNAEYDPEVYYNYAVKIPAGATSGELWIYDPVFCATDGSGQFGTGDRWFTTARRATSAYYTLYDTRNTLFDRTDDIQVASSGSLFANIRASDATLGGPTGSGIANCAVGATTNQAEGRYWHNRWWQMATGLQGGRTYRLHTRSTDPGSPSAMDDANGHNSFSLWARATDGAPKIHGLGAMQAFTPLDPDGEAEFYLAQIIAEHAGKTMQIRLWDPGDTGDLPADLQFLRPTATGYEEATFSYTAKRVASGAASCGDGTSWVRNRTLVTTNTGGYRVFNGCWLTIEIPLPDDYDAPAPPGLTEPGWWKIRYVMGGDPSDEPAFDLTTWEVTIKESPLHLVDIGS